MSSIIKERVPWRVYWSKNVDRQLANIPQHLREKFTVWVMVVERVGLSEARKIPGYHDEPLKGRRTGQRSIRLNRAYRAIYIEHKDETLLRVEVIEVTKHDY